jgi:hypothetical protein
MTKGHGPLSARPAPSREFSDRLREHLRALDSSARRPPRLWVLVGAYALAGIALLIIAAAGVGI